MFEFILGVFATVIVLFIIGCLQINPQDDEEDIE
jgi:hypothetical protein